MSTIITNFAYGNGPYCRAVDLAIALNNRLPGEGLEKHQILIPLVYGRKQMDILGQNLATAERETLLFDEK